MAEPCKQESTIGSLEATVDAIKDNLSKLSEGQDRFIRVLEKIAQQGEKIKKLEDGHDLMFTRVRDVELKVEGDRIKLGGVMALIGGVVSIITAIITKHLTKG